MEHQLSQGKKRHRIIYILVMSAVFNLKVDLPRFCIQKYSTTFSNVTLLGIRHICHVPKPHELMPGCVYTVTD